jgi:hypothetical protein
MNAMGKLLLCDPDNQGFIARLVVETDATEHHWDTFFSTLDDDAKDVWDKAIIKAKGLLEVVNTPLGSPIFYINESDYSKYANRLEKLNGKSMGVGLFCGLFAAGLGLTIRTDVAFTGCLEADGRVTFVYYLDSKLNGEYGAQSDTTLRTVVIPPGPTGSTTEEENAYECAIRSFPSNRPDTRMIVIRHIHELFLPENFEAIFDLDSFLRYLLSSELIDNIEQLREDKTPEAMAFASLICHYTENFWVFLEKVLAAGSSLFDLGQDCEYELFRTVLLRFAERRDTSNILGLLKVVGQNYSSEYLAKFPLEVDLRAIYEQQYVGVADEFFRQGHAQWNDLIKNLPASVSHEDVDHCVKVAFAGYRNLLFSMLHLLEGYFDLNPLLARELFREYDLFQNVNQCFQKAFQAIHSKQYKLDDVLNYILYGDIVASIQRLMHHYFSWLTEDDNAADGTAFKPLPPAMTILVQPDLSSLEFKIDVTQTQDYLHQIPQLKLDNEFKIYGGNVIKEPVLLWEESRPETHCVAWRSADYDAQQCRISQLPDGQPHLSFQTSETQVGLIPFLFGRFPMMIQYPVIESGPCVHWSTLYQWPPSIDSLWFMKVLRE